MEESIRTIIENNYNSSFFCQGEQLMSILYDGLDEDEQQFVYKKYKCFVESLTSSELCAAWAKWYVTGEGFRVFNEFPGNTRNLINYLLTKDVHYIYQKTRGNEWQSNAMGS
jgi:hypothetical protein